MKMPTNRSIYFELSKLNNKYLTRTVIKALLDDANGFNDGTSLFKSFDDECIHYDELLDKIERIKAGEPYQYVLGYSFFVNQIFEVNPSVLIPRQETEHLVMNAKLLIEKYFDSDNDLTICDVCTGSGCIAITLKRYFKSATVYATDIDENCLAVARKNAKADKINFLQGNMLEPLIKHSIKVDLLISNPPYIENIDEIDEQVYKYEPHKALLAKPNTFYYEQIFNHADKVLNKGGLMIFEIGEDMEERLTNLVNKYFPEAIYLFSKDLYSKTRFLTIINKEEEINA